jgi:hypothetical protein
MLVNKKNWFSYISGLAIRSGRRQKMHLRTSLGKLWMRETDSKGVSDLSVTRVEVAVDEAIRPLQHKF